jgi:acyl transferase domain-containing protein
MVLAPQCAAPPLSDAPPLSELGLWQLCRMTLQSAHLAPADVAYVAVHGTGTPLGDPIEVGALGAALGGIGSGGSSSGGTMAPLVIGSSQVTLRDGLEALS